MSLVLRHGRVVKFAAALAATLALGACASQTPSEMGAGGGLGGAGAATPGSQQDFVVNVGDRVFFTADSSDLTTEARGTLDRQSAWLARYARYTVTVEGHADERGTREYNIALGARRAAAARDYLISRGVPPTRLKTISYGKERPVAVCDADTCWNQNRRAVTVLNGAGS
ncbi:peptidoglycan-associated lipoprotein Pal [Prosthecodimorpha staleyi]|uniref:Peptidoglycan-associated lipoprotein n=1 Tax=Prosthecodimorpha staleyi TaxID=2840188 RepID=A0A947D112_9HYPH|nr:peptidoglycan-associated lipoprotein Pal [Prosthecodimorpha staleyi]MBT9288790.1 peptidoglycan-associated lipoprotein Pal [Prosthecodimorpha staleyi]